MGGAQLSEALDSDDDNFDDDDSFVDDDGPAHFILRDCER